MIGIEQNGRLYLDFNATSPYSKRVEDYLKQGSYLFGNPSSTHSSGKKSKRYIRECSDHLKRHFELEGNHEIFFHSGATEGINTLLFGAAKYYFSRQEKVTFFMAATDHSCVVNQRDDLEMLGHQVIIFPVDQNGDFDRKALIELMNQHEGTKLLNYTWINNETGVCWDLEDAAFIKEKTQCIVHVDAVQSVGKIENWQKLLKTLDAYTYSAHKFGSLKGVGFSFVKADYPFLPLLKGGDQQNEMRSGTENADGIYSISLALEDVIDDFDPVELSSAKGLIESRIGQMLSGHGEIIGANAKRRNLNTINFVLDKVKADVATTAFDLIGIDVSSGSACSSGSIQPSRILLAMGQNEVRAKSALRLSFPYTLNSVQANEIIPKLEKVLSRFC